MTKRKSKSASPKKRPKPLPKPDESLIIRVSSYRSGGVDVDADAVNVGGDVIGRDKMTAGGDLLINSTKIVYSGEDPTAAQELLYRYLKLVVDDCAPLKLKAIDQSAIRLGQQPLGLTSVYVGLNLDFRIPANSTLALYSTLAQNLLAVTRHRYSLAEVSQDREKLRSVSALEALAYHPRLTLLGAPGSGKSTLSLYLALCLARAGLGDEAALAQLSADWTHGPLLPVRVVLHQFAASLPVDLNQGRAARLWQFISNELVNAGLPDKTGALLQEVAAKSGALFLLDGLDEAGDEMRRARVLEAVAEFTRTAGEQCRFLLTARPYAWEAAEQRIADMPAVYRLADFDSDQIEMFVERWYQAVSDIGWIGAAEAAQKTADLTRAVQREDLQTLARNPLLLTLMATLHSNRTRLPDDRADLYNEVVELLLQRWTETTGADRGLLDALHIPTLKLGDLRERIEQLAFEAHAAHVGKEGAADISETALLEAFRPLLGGSRDKAALVVEYVEKRAGLLLGQGARENIRQFTFPHRTFQEYLAACYLAGQADFSERAVDLARAASAHWREALVLAARRAGPGRGVSVADALIHAQSVGEYRRKGDTPDETDWRLAIVAGAQLLEIGLAVLGSRESYRVVRERVAGWLLALIETPRLLSLRDRIEAGSMLARLGDPRFTVQTRADGTAYVLPPTVRVEAGPYEMGSNRGEPDAYEYEYSAGTQYQRHLVNVPEFWIGRYPVTNAEYHWFIRSTGYEAPRHWPGGSAPPGYENHPVVNVSWRDALAYCDWLSKVSKRMIRLPTEAEWEKAARWDGGARHSRIYPWGDERDTSRCNTGEEGPRDTTSVGMYPDGISPAGLFDAAGNVWEWTLSLFKPYPYDPNDGREDPTLSGTRVLRGGSWDLNQRYSRCPCRSLDHPPGSRGDDFGFRVVVSPAPRYDHVEEAVHD